MNEAVARFADDLIAAGADTADAADAASLYHRALVEASAEAWEKFYRATFECVNAVAPDGRPGSPRSEAALESLRRLLDDDFGAVLFGGTSLTTV